MEYSLPKINGTPVKLSHFPTKHQAFIFRAYEYVSAEKIAAVLGTDAENVRRAATEMGLPDRSPSELWLKRGYITIIRRMWHILPYDQLLELLDMDEQTLARTLRDEDFLDVKLTDKPDCERVSWRELTEKERIATQRIREIVNKVDLSGKSPFEFEYQVPMLKFGGEERFSTRMIYAFSGLYQHAFDIDSEEYISDSQLEAYRRLGVNGIWTQGILSQLADFPFDPTVSMGYRDRLIRMKKMTERLDKFGIKLYLYLNEPRSMPLSFFDGRQELRGHVRDGEACLCTSSDEVRRYLTDSVESICREVPLIGGFFTITRSENLTNCYSHSGDGKVPCSCPRCSKKSVAEVVSDTVKCFLDGARRVSGDIKVFAWSWRWDEHAEEIIRALPDGVILLSQSELDIPFDIGGVKGNVLDYSMSITGPGELAEREWAIARERGLEIGAKVQINTTWEASTVPAIPVSPSIDRHIGRLRDKGVKHLLLSWTLGGYPCRNIAAAAKHFYEVCDGYTVDTSMSEAERQFSEAFKNFPFHIDVLYFGPQNAGPSNLLFEEPTSLRSTMTCFPYDDLDGWRGIYPVDVFEDQLKRLCEGWEKGLSMIKQSDESEGAVMAMAAYCLFRSSLDQTRFIRSRNEGRYADAVMAAKNELNTARQMLILMNKNAAIGYEASNHYYFSKGQLLEKIVNCSYIIDVFSKRSTE